MENKFLTQVRKFRFYEILRLAFLVCTLLVTHLSVNAQTTELKKNIKMNNVTVQDLVDKLGTDFKYSFFIVDELVGKTKVTVDIKNATVTQILDLAFKDKEITYTVSGKSITVVAKKKQQDVKIVKKKYSGVVTDNNEAPIIGATVVIDGANSGTITDMNGKFILEAPIDGILKVSYIGYEVSKTRLTANNSLKIKLKEDTKLLDEVVVVGYGTIKKSDLTGSVASLANKNSEQKPVTSMEQMLQGQVSGVQITENSGGLGGGMTFSIRGASSTSGTNQPLVVIDGYPVQAGSENVMTGGDGTYVGTNSSQGMNILSTLNPNDIESIEVLKDASSTAIYGSRGANGVVMITTKRGKEGKDKVEYSFRTDISYLPSFIQVLNTNDFLNFANEAYFSKNDGSLAYSKSQIDEYGAVNTNWQDLLFRTGISQSHQLNLSGGDKKYKYSLAMGYVGQEGIVENTRYDRGTFRLNIDREVNVKFKYGFNVSGNMSLNKAVNQSSTAGEVGGSIVSATLRSYPFQTGIDANSEIATSTSITNPLILYTKADDQQRLTQINASGFADYKLLKELTFRIRVGANNSSGLRQYYMPRGTYMGEQKGGYAYQGHTRNFDYLTEYTLNYSKTFKSKHSINAVGGYTWQNWIMRSDGVNVGGFPNDNFTFYNLSSASSVSKPVNQTTTWSLASFLGRINYTYDKRYLFTVSLRDDGSTRLAPGKKWSLFPSGAIGWNVHNEKFMKNQEFVSELKLRASYGIAGNQSVSVGSTLSQYGSGTAVINQTIQTVYNPNNMPNNTLTWETTEQANAGFDLSIIKNRFGMSFDMYRKETSSLLINLPIPGSTGYVNYTTNAGSVENKGLEFSIRGNILTGKFTWSANGNISFNRNKILAFDGVMQSYNGPNNGTINNQPLTIAKIGYPIGAFYGYKIIGIYQTQDEINGYATDPANPIPGSFKFADISGPSGVPDGLISDYDRTILGNPYPDYIFGLNNDFTWKGFSLNVFIQGSIGQSVVNANRYVLDGMVAGSNIRQEAYDNRWTGPGTSNTYPGARSGITQFGGRFTDFILEDASFVRLKSVTLSYSFETKWIKPLTGLKMFVSGKNLFTLSDYKGYDPEINSQGQNSMTQGIDGGSIPQYRTFSVGLTANF